MWEERPGERPAPIHSEVTLLLLERIESVFCDGILSGRRIIPSIDKKEEILGGSDPILRCANSACYREVAYT